MLKQTRITLSVIIITALLSGTTLLSMPSCTPNQADDASAQNGTSASDKEEQDTSDPSVDIIELPPLEVPERKYPNLGSPLDRLVLAEEQGEAEEFARQRGIELIDGSVLVILEYVPGQCEAAAEAATRAGARDVQVSSHFNWLLAVVPVTSLVALAEAESISFIKLEWGAEDE